jgi:hypothetical protein
VPPRINIAEAGIPAVVYVFRPPFIMDVQKENFFSLAAKPAWKQCGTATGAKPAVIFNSYSAGTNHEHISISSADRAQ